MNKWVKILLACWIALFVGYPAFYMSEISNYLALGSGAPPHYWLFLAIVDPGCILLIALFCDHVSKKEDNI